MTSSCVTKTLEFRRIPLTKGPVTWSFDDFFVISMNKQFYTQSSWRLFETPWHSYNVIVLFQLILACHTLHIIWKPISLGLSWYSIRVGLSWSFIYFRLKFGVTTPLGLSWPCNMWFIPRPGEGFRTTNRLYNPFNTAKTQICGTFFNQCLNNFDIIVEYVVLSSAGQNVDMYTPSYWIFWLRKFSQNQNDHAFPKKLEQG